MVDLIIYPMVMKDGWLENLQTEWRFESDYFYDFYDFYDFYGPWLPASHVTDDTGGYRFQPVFQPSFFGAGFLGRAAAKCPKPSRSPGWKQEAQPVTLHRYNDIHIYRIHTYIHT